MDFDVLAKLVQMVEIGCLCERLTWGQSVCE